VIHDVLDDALRDDAAGYVLGTLEPAAASAYRLHLTTCAVCRDEVASLSGPTATLAYAAPPEAPSADVRAHLLAAARGYVFVPSGAGTWSPVAPGIERKDLASGTASRSYLIRMAPGAVGGRHEHTANEHCLVLEGDFSVAGRRLAAGDFHLAAAGSAHAGNRTDGGCLLLIVEAP
jgi:anti-sigma factor ChrR (cupin superfamily)